jgi:hypothetical protein
MQGKHRLFFAPRHLCVFALIFQPAQDAAVPVLVY